MLLKPVQNGAKHFLKSYFEGKQWSTLLYDVIQKIEFEPENFEIFKTETVAQSQNLLARIYFQLVVWQIFANSNLRLLSD